MSFPLVSIVIPSYKPAHFEQCLRSAIGQTYPNIEILVSDNCPTEEIRQICSKFNDVIYQRNSVYKTDNVVAVFFSGKGEYIKPLLDDDILHPFCVERMVASILSRPDIELVFSASAVINASNLRSEVRRPFQQSGFLTGLELHRNMTLGFNNPVGECSTIMFKRSRLWDIGSKNLFMLNGKEFKRGLADVVLYWNLAQNGKAYYIDEELSYFRKDSSIASNSNPMTNPDFGHCMADYCDLLVASHAIQVVTTNELLSAQTSVEALSVKCGHIFPAVADAVQRYDEYCKTLPATQHFQEVK